MNILDFNSTCYNYLFKKYKIYHIIIKIIPLIMTIYNKKITIIIK